jgi:predicted nucleic acid-binding protein
LILYLDTSALVKLYLEEDGSAEVRASVEAAEAVCTSMVAYAEVHAALARAAREGRITEEERAQAAAEFRADWPEYAVVQVTQRVVDLAAELAAAHGLRGFDAIHLASALVVRAEARAEVRFLAWDERIDRAARAVGLAGRRGRAMEDRGEVPDAVTLARESREELEERT